MYNTIHPELKKAIATFLIENPNLWQRSNATRDHFREYIYNKDGNYLIGGEAVSDFITELEKLL